MANSTRQSRSRKAKSPRPRKPRRGFPLFQHQNGQWAKKVLGRLCYFGKIADDPQGEAALDLWLNQKDALLAGRTPRVNRDGLTVGELSNRFLAGRRRSADAGELTSRVFKEYCKTCERVEEFFGPSRAVDGLGKEDFERYLAQLPKNWGPETLGVQVNKVRSLFRFAYDTELVDRPVRFGEKFKRPSASVFRRHRQDRPVKTFEADEILELLDIARPQPRAMILLAVNAGMGNVDIGGLRNGHLVLADGWFDCPRLQSDIERRCFLWRETVEAIRAAIAVRPAPKDPAHADHVFLTRAGSPWTRDGSTGKKAKSWADTISPMFRVLLDDAGIRRGGRSFRSLKRTFEIVANDTGDTQAINQILGHVNGSALESRRRKVNDERLRTVADSVHRWLFANSNRKWSRRERLGKAPSVASCIESVLPTDRQFTTADIMSGLEALDPRRVWRKQSVNGHIARLRGRGLVRRLRRGQRCQTAVYERAGV